MATIHALPEIPAQPAPRWDADNPAVKKIAKELDRRGVTAGEAYGAVSSCPEYLPVAEALERIAETSRDMIRAASRR